MKKIKQLILSLSIIFYGVNLQAQNTYYGTGAGYVGVMNTAFGYYSGDVLQGYGNSTFGHYTGKSISYGSLNTFAGYFAGRYTVNATSNSFMGSYAGYNNTEGDYNLFFGIRSGNENTTGSNNLAIGSYSGYSNSTGSANVFFGHYAGYYETGSNKLYIENSNDSIPLIYGEFDNDLLSIGGRLGIGTRNVPDSIRLAVDGTIIAKEVIITIDDFPDYVFEKSYKLRSLSELESFIGLNGHLPDVPSAEQVEKEGVKMGEMDALLLKKIEELTLYVIEIGKENEKLLEKNRELADRLIGIENMSSNEIIDR